MTGEKCQGLPSRKADRKNNWRDLCIGGESNAAGPSDVWGLYNKEEKAYWKVVFPQNVASDVLVDTNYQVNVDTTAMSDEESADYADKKSESSTYDASAYDATYEEPGVFPVDDYHARYACKETNKKEALCMALAIIDDGCVTSKYVVTGM